MVLSVSELSATMFLLGSALTGYVTWRIASLHVERRQSSQWTERVRQEQEAGQHLCLSTLESLCHAIEASDPYNAGHIDCVQRCALHMAQALGLPESETEALRAAALLHNIGRLGVPDYILHKPGSLTPEEQEKLRTHPVLGARILAPIPFPWPVVEIVRHHAEHWDGQGYPDGLKGEAIPLGARILAVANAYSAWIHARPYRDAQAPETALAEIELRAGAQFDPAVVAAFRPIADQVREELGQSNSETLAMHPLAPLPDTAVVEARAALHDIADAQRQTRGLAALTEALSGTLHLEAVIETVLTSVRELVPLSACALFLPEEDGEYLRAHGAVGINSRHLFGSSARIGSYLTGRAYYRGDMIRASYLAEDLVLRTVSDTWTPLRSTLIVPLTHGSTCVGTLNLYAEEPDAFGPDAQRILRLIALQAARAVDNACRFADIQKTANTDALTGLKNGRFLRVFLERELNRAHRDNSTLAVLNIDVDHFKTINDTYGHAAGDQTLRDIAGLLNAPIRSYDLAARYAGDEFVVVLPHADREQAEIVAAKLQGGVERYAQKMRAQDPSFPHVGISIGIAVAPTDGEDLQDLLRCSDAAMYQDKQRRRQPAAA